MIMIISVYSLDKWREWLVLNEASALADTVLEGNQELQRLIWWVWS